MARRGHPPSQEAIAGCGPRKRRCKMFAVTLQVWGRPPVCQFTEPLAPGRGYGAGTGPEARLTNLNAFGKFIEALAPLQTAHSERGMESRMSKSLRDLQPKLARVTSTATRLWSKAQGWTEGTTLGSGDGGAPNPNGVVAGGVHRRLVFRPRGRNPVGVDGRCRAITQGWQRANPGLCSTTPLGLEFSAAFWHIPRLGDKGPAQAGNFRKVLPPGREYK
jgi:hypothetical protein